MPRGTGGTVLHAYVLNYYTSPELFSRLYLFNICACGTIWPVRHGMPEAFKKQRWHHHTAAGTKHFQGERRTSCQKISQVLCPHAVHHAHTEAGKDQRQWWCWSQEATLHCWLCPEYRGREWVNERNIVIMDECFWINAPQWHAWQKKKKKKMGEWTHQTKCWKTALFWEKQSFSCSLWPSATCTICTARLLPSNPWSPIVRSSSPNAPQPLGRGRKVGDWLACTTQPTTSPNDSDRSVTVWHAICRRRTELLSRGSNLPSCVNSVRSPCVFLTVFRLIIPQVTTSEFSGGRRKVVPWMVLVTTKCFFSQCWTSVTCFFPFDIFYKTAKQEKHQPAEYHVSRSKRFQRRRLGLALLLAVVGGVVVLVMDRDMELDEGDVCLARVGALLVLRWIIRLSFTRSARWPCSASMVRKVVTNAS